MSAKLWLAIGAMGWYKNGTKKISCSGRRIFKGVQDKLAQPIMGATEKRRVKVGVLSGFANDI